MPSKKILSKNQAIVAEILETLKSAQAGVLVDYRGLTVEEDTVLRAQLREAGVEYKVVKNTLTRFAANQTGLEALDPILHGPTSLAVSVTDPIAPAKILAKFAEKNKNLEIKAGFMDGKVMNVDEVLVLAKTPSKDELIAKIMGSLKAPVSNFVYALNALLEKRTAEEGAPEAAVEAVEVVAETTEAAE